MNQDEDLYFTAYICEEKDDWRTTREASRRTETPCLFRYGSRSHRYACMCVICAYIWIEKKYIYICVYLTLWLTD